jgi:hypothetical protein
MNPPGAQLVAVRGSNFDLPRVHRKGHPGRGDAPYTQEK